MIIRSGLSGLGVMNFISRKGRKGGIGWLTRAFARG